MRRVIQIIFLLILPSWSLAQGGMLILKKNGKLVTSYYEGSDLDFNSGLGMQQAQIVKIKDDSLSMVHYDVRRNMTNLGVYVLDTAAVYRIIISYKDIIAIGKKKKGGWDWEASGATLFGGGALLTTAGLLTWVFASRNSQYYASSALVISSAIAAGVGYLIMRGAGKGSKYDIGKKYTLELITAQ